MKYRKKPLVVEAIQWIPEYNDLTISGFAKGKIEWVGQACGDNSCDNKLGIDYPVIKTLEGKMTANPGDWIIRGIKGEIYPCKPDIFEATYEAVGEEWARNE